MKIEDDDDYSNVVLWIGDVRKNGSIKIGRYTITIQAIKRDKVHVLVGKDLRNKEVIIETKE